MPINLPTNLLRSFVAIVDNGSMLSAADKVFVTQSALSLQIKRLEELLQLPLFNRDGRRLSLTSSGELMLGYARRVLQLHDEAITAVTVGQFAGRANRGVRGQASAQHRADETAAALACVHARQEVVVPLTIDLPSCGLPANQIPRSPVIP